MRTRPVPTPQLWTREGHEEPRRRDVEGARRSRSRRGPPRDATRESPGRPGDGAHTRHTQGRARRLRKSYGKTTDRPPRRTRGNQGSRTGRRARAVEPPEELRVRSHLRQAGGSQGTTDSPTPPRSLLGTPPTLWVSVRKGEGLVQGNELAAPSLPANPSRTADAREGRHWPLRLQQVLAELAPPRGLPSRSTPVATIGLVLQL